MPDHNGFFNYARERYRVRLARFLGKDPPWTADPVLRRWYFCNVFREDDRTTKWFRENVRDKVAQYPGHATTATVAFRWFNYIPTGERIKDVLLTAPGWDEDAVRAALPRAGKVFTGAYIIMPCPGERVGKLDGVCRRMEEFLTGGGPFQGPVPTMEEAHAHLSSFGGLGPFMAYEVVCDLRYTSVLRAATDAHTWANPGPGCKRGLRYVFPNLATRDELAAMRELLGASRLGRNWPEAWPDWDMRTVEHTLCEYDKYMRARGGGLLKRRYYADA